MKFRENALKDDNGQNGSESVDAIKRHEDFDKKKKYLIYKHLLIL